MFITGIIYNSDKLQKPNILKIEAYLSKLWYSHNNEILLYSN